MQISVIYVILAYQTKNIPNLPTIIISPFLIAYSKGTLCRTFTIVSIKNLIILRLTVNIYLKKTHN